MGNGIEEGSFMIQTKGLLHIGMPVVSTKETIKWYCDYMGFELVYETVYTGHEIAENVAFIRKDGVTYELYEFLGGKEREEVIASPKLIDHIAYEVEDVEAAYAEAKRLGLNIKKEIQDLPFWENGCRYFMVTTANGDTVEYMQML